MPYALLPIETCVLFTPAPCCCGADSCAVTYSLVFCDSCAAWCSLAVIVVDAKFTFATLFLAPRTRAQLLDFLLTKAISMTMFVVIPWHLGLPVLSGYVARLVVAGITYISVISLNHQHPDGFLQHGYPGQGTRTDWFRRQLHCTKDTAPESWLLNAFTGGLSLHVVHHTLPSLSMWHLPRATAAAREFLAANGLPYRPHASVWEGLANHQRMLRLMGSPELWAAYCKEHGIDAS
jgi:fatty acid desaturase